MELTALSLDLSGGVARLTLTSPETGNALDERLIDGLYSALNQAVKDPTVRVLVLRGEGPSFCAGMARELAYQDGQPNRAAIARFEHCLSLLAECPLPTLALVETVAAGGGVGLAAACDLVLAGPEAKFSLPEARFGLIPATIAPYLLRRLPPARLRALALSMRAIGPEEAFTIGLVDEVLTVPVEAGLERRLKDLLKAMPEALTAIKALVESPDAPGRGGDRLAAWLDRPDVRARLTDGGCP